MIIILSPSKNIVENSENLFRIEELSDPIFLKQTLDLSAILKNKSTEELMQLMSISKNLAEQNSGRFKSFSKKNILASKTSALDSFSGEAFQALEAKSFTKETMQYAKEHLRILSGMYGMLKPHDKFLPYRLEMGSRNISTQIPNLYDFWGEMIANQIIKEDAFKKNKIVVNLASQEYSKSISKYLKANMVNIEFYEYLENKQKVSSIEAKQFRGSLARWICTNMVKDISKLKQFNEKNVSYSKAFSSENLFVFRKNR